MAVVAAAEAVWNVVLETVATWLSTYCLVESCNEVVGSCVTVTVVKPDNVDVDAPKEMAVEPIVMDELVSPALGMVVCAVNAPVPLPTRYPVNVDAPVPPFATGRTPVTPVVNGKPVAFDNTAEDGVPSAGVTSVGEFDNTTDPVPVDVVVPVPPAVTGNVPVVKADVDVAYIAPPEVNDVSPVPPLAVPRVPLT